MAQPTGGPLVRALSGAVALLLGRPVPAGAFDTSFEGFWRSFGAVVLVLPSFAISLLAEARMAVPADVADVADLATGDAGMAPLYVLARGLGLVGDWVALPLALALLARPLGLGARYVPYIVARNWTSVLAAAIYAVPALFFAAGMIGEDTVLISSLVALAIVVHFQYRVVRGVLATPIGTSVGIVALDLVLSLVVTELAARLVGG